MCRYLDAERLEQFAAFRTIGGGVADPLQQPAVAIVIGLEISEDAGVGHLIAPVVPHLNQPERR